MQVTSLGSSALLSPVANPRDTAEALSPTSLDGSEASSALISPLGVQAYEAAAVQGTFSVKQALALWDADPSASAVTIRDSRKNIQSQWTRLVAKQAALGSITQTDPSASLTLTRDQFVAGIGVLNKINNGNFKSTVLGAKVADITAIQSYGSKIGAFTVNDSASNLAAGIADMAAASNLARFDASEGKKTVLDVAATDFADYGTLLKKYWGGAGKFNVQDTAANVVANSATLLSMRKRVSIAIADTAANVASSLSGLNALRSRVSEIVQSGSASYSLNVAEVRSYQALLGKVKFGQFELAVTDTAAALQSGKGWAAISKLSSNITALNSSDGALTLSTKQLETGSAALSNLDASVSLSIKGNAGGVTKVFDQLLSMESSLSAVTLQGRGYIGMSMSAYSSSTALLAKFTSADVGLAIKDANATDIADLFADVRVKTIDVATSGATAISQDFMDGLADARIKQVTVSEATVAQFQTLSTQRKVKSIGIQDDTSVLSTAETMSALHAAMRRNKRLVTGISANNPELMSVAYTEYKQYASTVFKASRNFALQVDFSAAIPASVTDPGQLRNWAQTSAKSNGTFQIKLWDGTKGKYGAAMTLGQGVNFVKYGQVATFLDSGDRNLNAVLYGGTFKWMQSATALTPSSSTSEVKAGVYSLGNGSARTTIKYSFLTSAAQVSSDKDKNGFAEMNAAQKASVTEAVNYISSLVNLKFELVNDPASADIRFGTNNQGTVSGGYATGANSAMGDVNLMLNNAAAVNATPEAGNYGWSTVVHEIGHTLGLKHPGAYNAGGGIPQGPFLSKKIDDTRLSVMSYKTPKDAYNWVSNGQGGYSRSSVNAFTYMPLDIAALQFLYGKNTSGVSTTDSSLSLADYQVTSFDNNWLGMETLVSTSAGLTMNMSAVSGDNIIDLREGAYSSINVLPDSYNSQVNSSLKQTFFNLNNVGLAWGSQVSTVQGGSGSDVVFADQYSTSIDGGSGLDKVYLYGGEADWTSSTQGAVTTYVNGSVSIAMTAVESVGYYDADRTSNLHSRLDLTA